MNGRSGLVLLLVWSGAAKGELIEWQNVNGLDWRVTPVDISVGPDDQDGDSGFMMYRETHHISFLGTDHERVGAMVVGEGFDIPSETGDRRLTLVDGGVVQILPEWDRTLFVWMGDQFIDAFSRKSAIWYGGSGRGIPQQRHMWSARVMLDDGWHWGYVITQWIDDRYDQDLWGWGFETEPGVQLLDHIDMWPAAAEVVVPEPSVWVMAMVASVFLGRRRNWR